MFENDGGEAVKLEWRSPDAEDFAVIPESHLATPADEVKVTSPGKKTVIHPGRMEPRAPGDGLPLTDVHPSYDLTDLHRDDFKPKVGGIDFLSNGRMVLCTWDERGDVFLLDGVTGDHADDVTITRFASGLAEPLGLKVVDDRIFVLQKQELTELIDHNGDGVADEYRCVASGWPVSANFHEFAFGLVYHEGHFYFNLAIAIDPGGANTNPQVPGRGTCIKVDPQTGEYEYVAGGLRTPNGIGVGPEGTILVADNQGGWVPTSKIVHIRPGRHYGNHLEPPGEFGDQSETPPVVWLPHGEIGNSPTEIVVARDGPYAGQLLLGDVTHGGLKRVFLEQVDGEYQGAVFRFTQGLHAGINRVRYGPDGGLFVGGIGSGGNWGQTGKAWYGLQRLDYNGQSAFEMLAVRAMDNGFEITLTEPLPDYYEVRPDQFTVQRFWYEPTAAYGGPKKDIRDVPIRSASLSDHRRRVFLETDGMVEGQVYYIRLDNKPLAASGNPLWSTEAWYTLNRVPTDRSGEVKPPPRHNVLTEQEQRDGWRLLFDGETLDGWRGFRKGRVPDGWRVVDGCITRVGPGGDLITLDQFDDFELSLEWRVGPGGNSGIFYRVSEDESAVYLTGPEMQVLDNQRHADGQNPETSAGSNYALHAPAEDVTRPVGQFNQARIVVRGDHVEHHLNGVKLLEYEIGSKDWQRRVDASKFRDWPSYGRQRRGHIALQDHGDPVWYRNIKVRELTTEQD